MNQSDQIQEIVRGLPAHEVTTTLRNPRGSSTRTFKGALLYDYARAAGMTPHSPSLGFGNYYYVATAADGFKVTVAYFEVTPRATDKQVLLAYEQDGEPLRVGVRLVVPGDDLGGRSILGVADIQLKSTPSVEPRETRPRADTLELTGLFKHRAVLTPADLSKFERHEAETQATPRRGGVMVPSRRYSGVLLWDVLSAAEPMTNPEINEDILRKVIIAHSTDGYSAVIAPGEVDPRFMAGNVLIATESVDGPLADAEGSFRLIVPYDKAVGRALKSLRAIELIEA